MLHFRRIYLFYLFDMRVGQKTSAHRTGPRCPKRIFEIVPFYSKLLRKKLCIFESQRSYYLYTTIKLKKMHFIFKFTFKCNCMYIVYKFVFIIMHMYFFWCPRRSPWPPYPRAGPTFTVILGKYSSFETFESPENAVT